MKISILILSMFSSMDALATNQFSVGGSVAEYYYKMISQIGDPSAVRSIQCSWHSVNNLESVSLSHYDCGLGISGENAKYLHEQMAENGFKVIVSDSSVTFYGTVKCERGVGTFCEFMSQKR